MKILVDINNKILKVLENDRSIFKGEQSADKLILYINQQLVNEYPVITGLLSNGRRIGPFTTDSSYGTETIDGTTYTTAEFTLSKENGFTLTEGNTQVTIWIYKTKDTEVISKTAIGNVTFNVVNTTSFNDGDIIVSGDVEGTVVNIKVELENLQSSVNAVNSRVNNLNEVLVKKTIEDISTGKTLQELYDEFGSCFVGKVGYAQRNGLFLFYKSTTQTNLTVCYGSNLKTYENVNMNLNVASLLGNSLGNPTYSNSYTDKEIDELITDLGRSKVSIYTPGYSITQSDEVVIRKRLTYDILTQPYTSSVIVAGRKYIAILDVKGGPNKQVKLFDFISNTYYKTSVIDTSNLTDYNTISFSTKSYYDKSKIDSLMLLKADKSTTYTKTETDSKTIQNLTINYNGYTNLAYQLLTMLANETINPYTTYYVNKRFEVVIHSSYSTNYGVYIKDITHPTRYYKTNFIDITTNFSINDVQITRVEWYDTNEVDNKLTRNNLISAIGEATESLSGIMSANDKKNLNTLVALLQDNENNITDTIKEVLAIFEQYPEGADLVSALAGKADKADTYRKVETDNLLAGKVDKTTYESKVGELEKNIRELDNTKIEVDSLLAKNNIKNYQEVLWLGSDMIPELPTQMPNQQGIDGYIDALAKIWTDIDDDNYSIINFGYNRVVLLAQYSGKLVKVEIVQESSGLFGSRVHSSVYKNNVKECISLNTNKRYKLINDTYETPQEPSYFLEEISGYSKSEVDNLIAGAGGESLVIDMGTYTNDSNEEALKELFVSIKNKALPITTNYIYTAKVNGFKVKGMFNDIQLKLDTNVYQNDAEVKYEVYYDDEDNLLVDKYFVPIYSETNTFTIYGDDAYFSFSPDDHFIEFYSEDGENFTLSPSGICGRDSQGNEYDIDWKNLYKNIFNIQRIARSEEFTVYDNNIVYCEISDIVNTNFSIEILIEGNHYFDLRFEFNTEGGFHVIDIDAEEDINWDNLIDTAKFGGSSLQNEHCSSFINFIVGEYLSVGDTITIYYVGDGTSSPYYEI